MRSSDIKSRPTRLQLERQNLQVPAVKNVKGLVEALAIFCWKLGSEQNDEGGRR